MIMTIMFDSDESIFTVAIVKISLYNILDKPNAIISIPTNLL